MQTKDHLALGKYLLNISGSEELRGHRRAFLLGCVEPDYNFATYLRGMRGHRKFRGHNAENSLGYLSKSLARLQTNGLRTAWDYFRLGAALHYAADAFTWPHNSFWEKSLLEHAAYEARLHEVFSLRLSEADGGESGAELISALDYFNASHAAYQAAEHGMETDCEYIIRVCGTLLAACLSYAKAGRLAAYGARHERQEQAEVLSFV